MHSYRLIPMVMVFAAAAAAQTPPLDQGTFTVTRDGKSFGTESFLITQQPSADGSAYNLTATRTLTGRTIRTSLKADSTGAPITYMRQETGASPMTLVATGRNAGKLTVSFSAG